MSENTLQSGSVARNERNDNTSELADEGLELCDAVAQTGRFIYVRVVSV